MNTPVMDALVEFVLDVELASLPADVVAGAQRSVTDWFGTPIRGSVEPLAVAIGKVIDATGGKPQATVIRVGEHADEHAAQITAAAR